MERSAWETACWRDSSHRLVLSTSHWSLLEQPATGGYGIVPRVQKESLVRVVALLLSAVGVLLPSVAPLRSGVALLLWADAVISLFLGP